MTEPVSADEARRRSDDAIRRIREESGRRVEGRRRWRAFSSWCALASFAGGLCVAVLDLRQREERPEVAPVAGPPATPGDPAAAPERARLEECLQMAAVARQVNALLDGRLAAARNERERASIRAELEPRLAQVMRDWAVRSCPAMPPHGRRQTSHSRRHHPRCGGSGVPGP